MGLQTKNYSWSYPPRSLLALIIVVVCSGLPTAGVAQSSDSGNQTDSEKTPNKSDKPATTKGDGAHSGPQDGKSKEEEKKNKDDPKEEQAERIDEKLGGNQVFSLKDGTQFVESNQGDNLIRVKPPGVDWDKSYLIEKDLFGVSKNESGGFSFKKPDYGDGLKPIGAVQLKGTEIFRPIYQKADGTTGFFNSSNEWVENTGRYDPFGTNEYTSKPVPQGYTNNQGRLNPSSPSGGSTVNGGGSGGGGSGGGGANPPSGPPSPGSGGPSPSTQPALTRPATLNDSPLPPAYSETGEQVPQEIVRAAWEKGFGRDPGDPVKYSKNGDGTWKVCGATTCLPVLPVP